jgi:hypothetical protein
MGRSAAGALVLLGFTAWPAVALSQETPAPDMLPDTRGATMAHLVERTILKVDVLVLTVRVDPTAAGELSRLLDARSKYDRDDEDAVAAIVAGSDEGVAEIEFLRGISLDQFLEGVRDDMGSALDADWIDRETFTTITTGLPEWFSFLADRGIKEGDVLTYHATGDSLRTTYREVGESRLTFDRTDVGEQNVRALWGGYYAPGSSFREGLTRSLWSLGN